MFEQFYSQALDNLANLGAALAGALALAFCYRLTHRRLGYDRSMVQSFILMAVTVCAIMMGIRSNLALSLGLVGALSIVRFRTAIKNPGDLLFMLIAITIGLITSTGDMVLWSCFLPFILVVIVLLHVFQFGTPGSQRFTIIFSCPDQAARCNRILERLSAQCRRVQLCSKVPAAAEHCEMTVSLSGPTAQVLQVLEELQQAEGITQLQLHRAHEIIEV